MSLDALIKAYSHPRFHPVLITEVTRMKGGCFCVAGWDLRQNGMVRPMPPRGKNWHLYERRVPFTPGQVVNCRLGKPRAAEKILPHCNEDFFVAERPWIMQQLTEPQMHAALLATVAANLTAVFGAELIEQRYLIEGTGQRSLGAIAVRRKRVFFFHDKGKLRLHFIDHKEQGHDLAVTGDKLLYYFSPAGEERDLHLDDKQANEWLELNEPEAILILRIGLARGWKGPEDDWNPKRCYAQLNGIICPRDNWPAFEQRRGLPSQE